MKWFGKMLCILVLMTSLCLGAGAETSPELSAMMEGFIGENGLNGENFSICYYNTVTGETYRFNENAFMIAASTFKLPLNLYYYQMELEGEISPTATIGGISLETLHRGSLVDSNNDYSISMLYNLGNYSTYKEKMRTYFTATDDEIQSIYYGDNYFTTEMMMDTLTYLYENQDDYTEMIDYMKEAQPTQWFASTKGDYEIAHKYGYYDGAINDVGIIYTEQPFLLSVYTYGLSYGEGVLGDVCRMLTDYTVAQYVEPEPEPEVVEEVVAQPEPEPEPEVLAQPEPEPEVVVEEAVVEVAPEKEPPLTGRELAMMICVAVALAAVGVLVVFQTSQKVSKK